MPTYTKLFNSIITSTIWSEDDKTRIIWITMLAMSDKNGDVHASIPGLARVSGMTIAEAEMAIGKLMSPDPYSRTPDNEGRRIAPIDGGWELLNHSKYRAMASKEDAKAATAQRVRRLRARSGNVTQCNASVTVCNASVTQNRDIADADTDTDKLATLAPPKSPKGGIAPASQSATPELPEVKPSGRRFPDHAAICATINALRPEWARPAHWSAAEMHALYDALAGISELSPDDWQLVKAYLSAKVDPSAGYWQPRNRSKFLETFPDVFASAQRWAGKTNGYEQPKSKLGGIWK